MISSQQIPDLCTGALPQVRMGPGPGGWMKLNGEVNEMVAGCLWVLSMQPSCKRKILGLDGDMPGIFKWGDVASVWQPSATPLVFKSPVLSCFFCLFWCNWTANSLRNIPEPYNWQPDTLRPVQNSLWVVATDLQLSCMWEPSLDIV